MRVPQFILSVRTIVIRGQSRVSDIEGSDDFFFRAIYSLLLESIEDPIMRNPSTMLYAWAARDSPSDITLEISLLVLKDKYILPVE